MEKMSKTAKVLGTIAKVLSVICLVCGCLFIAASVAVLFLGDKIFTHSETKLVLDSVEFLIAPEFAPDLSSAKSALCIQLVGVSVIAFFVSYMLDVVRRVFKPMSECRPFDESVSLNLRKLGFVTLIFGVLSQVIEMIAGSLYFTPEMISELFISEKITHISFEYEFETGFILAAVVIFLLSYIFKYGAELQKQSDETL